MRRTRSGALFVAALVCVAGCGHSRWAAKVLGDGVAIASAPIDVSIDQLRSLPRPVGVDSFDTPRVVAERQVYRVRADLLRFTLASDGDIHLAIAQPGKTASTVIAEIPDPDRMTNAPNRYRQAVAEARRKFIAEFGIPSISTWRSAHRAVTLTGPIFFDLLHGQVGGLFGGAPTGVEIHPVLAIEILRPGSPRRHTGR